MNEHDDIERYLTGLRRALRQRPLARRRILNEVEEHLRAAAAAAESEGREPAAAARDAIDRFGSAQALARGFAEQPSPLGRQLRVFAVSAAVAAAVLVGFDRQQTPAAQAHPSIPAAAVHHAHDGARHP